MSVDPNRLDESVALLVKRLLDKQAGPDHWEGRLSSSALATATAVPGLAAVVPFYGLPPSADWSRVDAPIQAHFASEDDWATVDGAKAIQQALAKHARQMELHVYAAKHAFCNDQRPEVYNPDACAQAWSRAVSFVRSHT